MQTCLASRKGQPRRLDNLLRLTAAAMLALPVSLAGGVEARGSSAPAPVSAGVLALDNSGNIYVAGLTDSVDFPTTSGAFNNNVDGTPNEGLNLGRGLLFGIFNQPFGDAFVTKYGATGCTMLATIVGQTSRLGVADLTGMPGNPISYINLQYQGSSLLARAPFLSAVCSPGARVAGVFSAATATFTGIGSLDRGIFLPGDTITVVVTIPLTGGVPSATVTVTGTRNGVQNTPVLTNVPVSGIFNSAIPLFSVPSYAL